MRQLIRVQVPAWAPIPPDETDDAAEEAASRMYHPDGRLAQLVRASRLHREGRGFESLTAHHCRTGTPGRITIPLRSVTVEPWTPSGSS